MIVTIFQEERSSVPDFSCFQGQNGLCTGGNHSFTPSYLLFCLLARYLTFYAVIFHYGSLIFPDILAKIPAKALSPFITSFFPLFSLNAYANEEEKKNGNDLLSPAYIKGK